MRCREVVDFVRMLYAVQMSPEVGRAYSTGRRVKRLDQVSRAENVARVFVCDVSDEWIHTVQPPCR